MHSYSLTTRRRNRTNGNIEANWVQVNSVEDLGALPVATRASTPEETPDAQQGATPPGELRVSIPGAQPPAPGQSIGHNQPSGSRQGGLKDRDVVPSLEHALGLSLFLAKSIASAIALSPSSSPAYELVSVPCDEVRGVASSPDRESKFSWQVLSPPMSPSDDHNPEANMIRSAPCIIIPTPIITEHHPETRRPDDPTTPSSVHALLGTPTSTGHGDGSDSPISERIREYVQAYVQLFPEITNTRMLETILEDESIASEKSSECGSDDGSSTIMPDVPSPTTTQSSIYSFHTAIAAPPSPACVRASFVEPAWRRAVV